MKLSAVIIENYRGYNMRTRIEIEDLTAFIGKNDAGKSTILEALELFFNDGKPEHSDVCVHGSASIIRIGCAFTSLPFEIVIDTAAPTTLAAEHLLNEHGELEIVKEWDTTAKTLKEAVYAVAMHPTNVDADDLLTGTLEQLLGDHLAVARVVTERGDQREKRDSPNEPPRAL